MTLKLFILAVLFVISGGVTFSEKFKNHKFLSLLATIIAILATFYLLQDIIDDIKQSSSSTQLPIIPDVVTTSQSMPYSSSVSSDETAQKIAELLKTCQFRFDNNWLTSGGSGTALACYKDVLKLEPNNLEASRGLSNIENQYVKWAERALKNGKKAKARQYLARLRKVNPESLKLTELETQIQSISLVRCNTSNVIRKVSASSVLKPQTYKGQKRTYNSWNVVDGDKSTAWVEGVRGNGINQWVKVLFDCKVKIGKISMIAGYTADRYRFEINNRVKRIRVSFSDGFSTAENLEDTMVPQLLDIQYIPTKTKWVKFEILDIYLGSKYRDTAISEIYFEIDEFLENE